MPEGIRLIKESDFDKIIGFFEGDNTIDKLKWLFKDPLRDSYNGFVAVNSKGKIVGVIGFTKVKYNNKGTSLDVITPMSWMLAPEYKGMLGVSLFKEAISQGSYPIIIGGSEISRKLYPMFGLKHFADAKIYTMVLSPLAYFRILHKKSRLKKYAFFLLMLPSYFKGWFKFSKNKVSLEKYNGNNFFDRQIDNSVTQRTFSKEYVDWIIQSPTIRTEAFSIKYEEKNIGMSLVSIKEEKNMRIGRIIYVPLLSLDLKLWAKVLRKHVEFFKSENCCVISCVALNNEYQNVLKKTGFSNFKKQTEPIYTKQNDQAIALEDIEKWHFQFSEGDIFSINF